MEALDVYIIEIMCKLCHSCWLLTCSVAEDHHGLLVLLPTLHPPSAETSALLQADGILQIKPMLDILFSLDWKEAKLSKISRVTFQMRLSSWRLDKVSANPGSFRGVSIKRVEPDTG